MKSIVFKQGTSRFVILLPALRIVLKVPRIKLFRLIKDMCFMLRKLSYGKLLLICFELMGPTEQWYTLRWYLFRGIAENWNEYQFYRKTRNPFLWKTNFSLFGLLNIQPLSTKTGYGKFGAFHVLYNIAGDELHKDNHHFANPNNFCSHCGKLRIHDYGSRRTQKIITKYGEQFATLSGTPEE